MSETGTSFPARTRPNVRDLLRPDRPLILPSAHDAFSARLIEMNGFKALGVSGSAMLAARYTLPDLGLAALTDMAEPTREILDAVSIAVGVDGDDGYGDVKSVVRMVRTYEPMGVGSIMLEDQGRGDKQPGQARARAVVPEEEIVAKLKAAMDSRDSKDFLINARTDALGAVGIDEALRRATRFADLGVDGVFVTGLQRPEDFERVGRELRGTLLMAALYDGAAASWLQPRDLFSFGFGVITLASSLIVRIADVMNQMLGELRDAADNDAPILPYERSKQGFDVFQSAVRLKAWADLED